jgi:hypothetical protein
VRKLFKIPLAFLFIGSCVGLFLRYQLISPVGGIIYAHVLHTHSHVVFLGWVFNVLIIAFTSEFARIKGFRVIFWSLQFCVIGMLLSFPFQGYGGVSITFSSLHTLCAFAFIILFFRSVKKQQSVALMLARVALLFFALSSLGPFFLGYLKANGLDHSNVYRFSIYFYLHFQYNGFFFFGILSLFIKLLENIMTTQDIRSVTIGSYILMVSCLPAYVLSVLWSQPPLVYNFIGFFSALAQLLGIYLFVQPLLKYFTRAHFTRQEQWLFSLSFAALVLKLILQLISAHPAAAAFANEFRVVVIAYLHLALLGFTSLFLITWLMRKGAIQAHNPWGIRLILTGFYASEMLLIISPWSDDYLAMPSTNLNQMIFLCSFLIVCGIGVLTMLPNTKAN